MSSENENKAALLEQLRINRDDEQRSVVPPRVWVILGAVVLLAVLGVLGWRYFAGGPQFTVDSASAAPPAQGAGAPAAAVLQATGYVTARRQATVSTQITGTLTEVLIEEGDHVKAGQVLARLDDTAQRASLAQAQAQAQAAEAQLVQYQAQLEQARRDLVRNQDLVARQLVSQQALEAASTQVQSLAAQVEAQRKQVQLARATVDGAQVQLGYTVVRAPFTGVVTAKAAPPGEIVSP